MLYLSPLQLIRKKCLECCIGQPKEVRLCDIEDCPLHALRFGKNPRRKGVGKRNNSRTSSPDRVAEHPQSEIVEKPAAEQPVSDKVLIWEVGS